MTCKMAYFTGFEGDDRNRTGGTFVSLFSGKSLQVGYFCEVW